MGCVEEAAETAVDAMAMAEMVEADILSEVAAAAGKSRTRCIGCVGSGSSRSGHHTSRRIRQPRTRSRSRYIGSLGSDQAHCQRNTTARIDQRCA